MFRQIYELTVLGMHPANPYPRRSRVAPLGVALGRGARVELHTYSTIRAAR